MESYLGRVQAIVWQAAEFVPKDSLVEVQHLVDHGEPADGLCSLAWAIVRHDARLPLPLLQAIQELTHDVVDNGFMPPRLTDYALDGRGGRS